MLLDFLPQRLPLGIYHIDNVFACTPQPTLMLIRFVNFQHEIKHRLQLIGEPL